jgi:hypothetical protein
MPLKPDIVLNSVENFINPIQISHVTISDSCMKEGDETEQDILVWLTVGPSCRPLCAAKEKYHSSLYSPNRNKNCTFHKKLESELITSVKHESDLQNERNAYNYNVNAQDRSQSYCKLRLLNYLTYDRIKWVPKMSQVSLTDVC